jgi:MFS transporter, FSR family, fosmidomycin resistance protein
VYGAWSAAIPFVRADLDLSYGEIGLVLGVGGAGGSLAEIPIGLLGDTPRRRALLLGGGAAFAAALALTASAQGLLVLSVGYVAAGIASGAFVGLSQAELMDAQPGAHERNMARWTLAGSAGVVAGPLALVTAEAIGLGWRGLLLLFGLVAFPLVARARSVPLAPSGPPPRVFDSLRAAAAALRRREVLRWLVLLELVDLMLDLLFGFLALYFVDVAGASPSEAGLAVAVWTVAGLVGDVALLPVLARVSGIAYLRASALTVAVVFPGFLLVDEFNAKLVLLALLGILNSGWYAIPKGRLYSALPGQSGAAIALGSVTGLLGSLFPLSIGLVAGSIGLAAAMWLLLAAPLALIVGLPRRVRDCDG